MSAQNLDPRKILSEIKSFCQETYGCLPTITPDSFDENTKRFVPEITVGGNSCKLMFCFRTDGKTSITVQGRNVDFGEELKNAIEHRCLISDDISYSFSIKYTDEMCSDFLTFLEKECKAIKKNEQKEEYGILYHYEGLYSDKLTIHKYDSGTLFIQGRYLWLAQQINYYFSSKSEYFEIVKTQNSKFNISFDKDKINSLEKELFSTTKYNKIPEELKIMIKTSLSFILVNVENLPDYSSFVYPILRGLESFMQYILSINCDNYGMEESIGGYFTEEYKKFVVKSTYRCNNITDDTQLKLGKIFSYYKEYRHKLFHTNTPTSETKFIKKKEEADKMIMDMSSLLNEGIDSLL